MRTLGLVLVVVVAGCGSKSKGASAPGAGAGTGDAVAVSAKARLDLQCTPQDGFDEAACRASGEQCGYGPPLVCRGVQVGPEQLEQERRERESGVLPCTCICASERMRCSMVP